MLSPMVLSLSFGWVVCGYQRLRQQQQAQNNEYDPCGVHGWLWIAANALHLRGLYLASRLSRCALLCVFR